MTCLPDVNVWIALAIGEHVHHKPAKEWFESSDNMQIAFCRVTQMGFLRLLTNPRVMAGDTMSAARAWKLFDALCQDSRVRFAPEPPALESKWRDFTRHRRQGANFWTDAYLAAFAAASNLTVVTFDAAFAHQTGGALRLLGRS
jgi:uncharacterized protein